MVALIFSLPTLFTHTWFAISLAILMVTIFSYFSLRLYFQVKKPVQLRSLCAEYLATAGDILNCQEETVQFHISLSEAACKLARLLEEVEYRFYVAPGWLPSLIPFFETVSCFFHWQDVLFMKEYLLLHSVHQHLEWVRSEPTNLEVHASLAQRYVALSHLYVNPKKLGDEKKKNRWTPFESHLAQMQKKYRIIAKQAKEEFTILSHYAPKDPWVHLQLAYSYRDLQMPEREIAQYERVLTLIPNDRETLFKLGVLYFQQGKNAEGLKIYERCRKGDPERAETLIQFYGAHKVVDQILLE